ncbi:probable carboxylesterase 17 [Dendrobium catenatum]|uniref:probable carboxylesterase 17 n=1 Tax=Dendrobium catenatum TaxID=906689 RepID=UPI0009F29EA1|nr:probable carboxylesterase 17 [Dendrobium catenatum]
MRRPKTGSLLLGSSTLLAVIPTPPDHSSAAVIEEIPGLIKLHRNGHVVRLPAMPEVPSTYSPEPGVVSGDVTINPSAGLWARIYVPRYPGRHPLPVLLYFHGGGFCVGSPAWRCYHNFLSRLAGTAACVVVSASYRLAPEHRLPAAYEDGVAALAWLRQQAGRAGADPGGWGWRARCDFGRVFVAGDSAGAAIAYSATAPNINPPARVRGLILIQPFFSGEARTSSERNLAQSAKSALTLAAADCYWRLSLPAGTNRDSIWCNPICDEGLKKMENRKMPPVLLCVAEMDILRDRNLEFCRALSRAGKRVELQMYGGVGHAFQVLQNYSLSEVRTTELISDVKDFMSSNR